MDKESLRQILLDIRQGNSSVDQALEQLSDWPSADLECASLDTHRAVRRDFCETILAQFKTPQQTAQIAKAMSSHHQRFLITRACPETFEAVAASCPNARYRATSRLIEVVGDGSRHRSVNPQPSASPFQPQFENYAVVACAGTSDLPVAEEALYTARFLGCECHLVTDIGVAGLHRVLKHRQLLTGASLVVAVAGMEGALASVLGGLVRCPLVAVPTSVGYGASFQGVSALLCMLNSCSPGVSVVNIDNGFGAGYIAAQICRGRRPT